MDTICGADCSKCTFREKCRGCAATCGKPFGKPCIAAQYIKTGGKEAYAQFKTQLLDEANALLRANGLPDIAALCEMPGFFLNLAYPLPGGGTARFLDDEAIYLGSMIAVAEPGLCCGVVADPSFLLVCKMGENGSDPELIAFQKR